MQFVALKENTLRHSFQNHDIKQTKHTPRCFFSWGDQGFLLKEGLGRGELPRQVQNFEPPASVEYHPKIYLVPFVPHLITNHIL